MRDDLDKLLCERERPRSWDHYSNYRNIERFNSLHDVPYDDEDFDEPFTGVGSGSRESMKFRHHTKPFGENLNPLYGVIRKNVGRRWNKVYSELCSVFDPRTVTGQHIFQHVYDQLAKPEQTFIGEDGKVWFRGSYSWGAEPIRDSRYSYYVDPRDGILKLNQHRKSYKQLQRESAARRAAEEAKTKRVIDQATELHLINGSWFEVKYQHFKGASRTVAKSYGGKTTVYATEYSYPLMYDVLQKAHVYASKVAVSKRTLSHRDLKRYGLAA